MSISSEDMEGAYQEFLQFLSSLPTKSSTASTKDPVVTYVSSASTSSTTTSTGRCPFNHGTVYAGPYPGYVHGNPERGICPRKCRPAMNVDVTSKESLVETMTREAMEYLELYYHERTDDMDGKEGFLPKSERMIQVEQSIHRTGTYVHTFDELEHGARLAWRNAPKCANRKYWQELKLLDCRDVVTNQGMLDSCIKHLTKAMSCGSAEAYITIFRPETPGSSDGPRIWNDQLLQYAAYNQEGHVIGDPKNLRFTQMLEERFNWKGPPDHILGSHDYLPLVIQSDPKVDPELFAIPLECATQVHIHHPQHPELSELGMKWYPIPAVCALDLSIGGILYTAAPFNGWYANTEVLRDLTDKNRYNMLVPVARALGLDPDTKPGDEALWIDEVMTVLNKAVYYSFKVAKVAMIGHHNMINMFWNWYKDELLNRGYCPVNWKWVIPPMSSSTSDAYLGLHKAQEYTLKPAYLFGKDFLSLERDHFGQRVSLNAFKMCYYKAKLIVFIRKWLKRHRLLRHPVLIIYASVTGNSSMFASKLGSILSHSSQVTYFDACGTNAAIDKQIWTKIEDTSLCIFITSTQGNGELPSMSRKFFSTLFDKKNRLIMDKQCAVLGFGSSAYPVFCGAAEELSSQIGKHGGLEVVSCGKCDAVKGEEMAFRHWTALLVDKLASMPDASPLTLQLSKDFNLGIGQTLHGREDILESVDVKVFNAEAVREAALKSFMSRQTLDNLNVSHNPRRSSLLGLNGDRGILNDSVSNNGSDDIDDAVAKASLAKYSRKDCFGGCVISREDLIAEEGKEHISCFGHNVYRQTSLLKLEAAGLPYQPGDHVRVYPRATISVEKLQAFIGNLTGELSLDDQVYVTANQQISLEELAITSPLLHRNIDQLVKLEHILVHQVSVDAPIPNQSCIDLACLALNPKEKTALEKLGSNKDEYEEMISLCGLRWIDVFELFPSLSTQVSLSFLLYRMKMNHPRSYSIASCKEVVGSEIHLVVGRFIYSRGDRSKLEVGVCSNFLTNAHKGDIITFTIESCPSFHHPLSPSSPVVFICTGTGFAPFRGLFQKRSYLKKRGENMGNAYLLFGCRSSKEGLFEDEIENFIQDGTLTDAYKCYSREPGKNKQYITDVMQTERVQKVLLPSLETSDCHVYICGSANLAQQSKSVLIEITSESHMKKIIDEGRLHLDVFGALA